MKVASTGRDVLKNAYRSTFQAYANRLDALQCLMSSGAPGGVPGNEEIEAAVVAVETARIAHNGARDRLARQSLRHATFASTLPPSEEIDEHRVRETAQLLWELAGRPAGTAERDWRRAERLVHTASSC